MVLTTESHSPDAALASRMARMQVEQLIEIASSTPEEGFRAEFIAAARAELDRRRIPDEERASLETDAESHRTHSAGKADEPLGWFGRIVFVVIGPFLLVSGLGVFKLYATGYKRKALHAFACILIAYGIYAALFVLITLFA